ncbi:hypothetical protein Enr13x_65080 [Stieleria neptunia]|uniref:Uncharacterized protein n=1 Tax=Stieleria neptunia TaxID=2527979 RepID=A0A518I0H7_9BACT|nr:hypothetical protein [Stieleria neptunia]QDV46599.1 hypothetical protein Enr13x_65080 [Stieleria neptunia]
MKNSRKNNGGRSDEPARRREAKLDYPVRLLVYALVATAVCQLILLAVRGNGVEFVGRENGPVELAQVVMALFTSGCLFIAAVQMPVGRTLLVLCGCLVGYAAARECDSWFESVFFDDAYKYLAGAPLLGVAIAALVRGRKQLVGESAALLRTPSMTIFAIAGIYICTLCQAFDVPHLWTAGGVSPSPETTKAAVEEFAELFGYLLLAFSGVESLAMAFANGSVETGSVEAASNEATCIEFPTHQPQPVSRKAA